MFPALSEERYYEYLCSSQVNPRVSYEQMVEVVDLAARMGFNFVVVADQLKRHALDPMICLSAFMVYCDIQSKRRQLFEVSRSASEAFNKAMQIITYYMKSLQNYDERCNIELDR